MVNPVISNDFNARVIDIFRNEYLSPRSPFVSLAVPKQGIGSWCKPGKQFEVEDSGLRALAGKSGGTITLPNGISFATPSEGDARNILFTSQWDNYPKSITLPLSGNASHAFLLMTGSTNAMQSQFVQMQIGASNSTGSTVSNLRIPLLKELSIPLFGDEPTQQKIAAVLTALDVKIDLNNRINAELEALAKTIYDYWFVQFDFPDAKGRPYKTSGGVMVWNEALGSWTDPKTLPSFRVASAPAPAPVAAPAPAPAAAPAPVGPVMAWPGARRK